MAIVSMLKFGAYQFPASFRLVHQEQDVVIDEQKIPNLEGTNAPQGSFNSQVIRLAGTIGGFNGVDSAGNPITNRDQCKAELNLLTSYLRAGFQQLYLGSSDNRTIRAQLRKLMTSFAEATMQAVADCEIEFMAPDPRWIGAAHNIAAAVSLAAVAAVNNGSTITYPKFTFTGAYTNNPGSGAPLIKTQLTLVMIGTDVLVIDCDPHNRANAVLLNGMPRLDLVTATTNTMGDAAFFPYLIAGANTVSAAGSVNGTSVSATYNDAFLI